MQRTPVSLAVMMVVAALGDSRAASADAAVLYVRPVEVYGNGVWFAGELDPIADAIAELLARPSYGGYRVLPNSELRALRANVRAGRLPGVAAACPSPPPPALLTGLLHPEAMEAEARVDCASRCRLEVTVSSAVGRETKARLEAQLPKGETPLQWAARLRRAGLRKMSSQEDQGGGLGMIGAFADRRPPRISVTMRDLKLSGRWSKPPSEAQLAPYAQALHACEKPETRWHDWVLEPYVVSIDSGGHVDRCEPTYPDHLPPPSFDCRCRVLSTIDFGRASGPRRASFDLSTSANTAEPRRRFTASIHLGEKTADDRSAILGTGELDVDAAAACLEPLRAPQADVLVPLAFRVGADGRVQSVDARWPNAFTAAQASCLDQVLRRATFNCPLSGHAQVTTELSVGVYAR